MKTYQYSRLAMSSLLTALLFAHSAQATEATPEQRAADLVGRMTLEEKAHQMVNNAAAIQRLGIPVYNWWSEALHGVARNGIATVYPEPIGLAATFDTPLIHQMGEEVSLEGRAKYQQARQRGTINLFQGLTFFSPNINIFRDPRWGRGQETFGEDPFLTGKLGVAFIKGMQGNDPDALRVATTAKHFAVHSGPEALRHGFDAKASEHDLHDTYLPAFREAVIDGNVASVMCVYNAVNGEPGCANTELLVKILRDTWQFKGFVVSDCQAVRDIYTGHHYVTSEAAAVAVAVKRGNDIECMWGKDIDKAPDAYVDAVGQGLLKEADIDQALRRAFTIRYRLGMFDAPDKVKLANVPESVIDSEAHRQTALQTARESMVLLKNNGVLPLAASTQHIAVVGPLANDVITLLGNYSGTPSRAVTALDGIRKQFPTADVTFSRGADFPVIPARVPTTVLHTDDGQPGLHADLFSKTDPKGAAMATKVDDMLSSLPGDDIGFIRSQGWLTAAETATYRIGFAGRGGNRLYLDDKLVFDDLAVHDEADNMGSFNFKKGQRYQIRIENTLRGYSQASFIWRQEIPDVLEQANAAAKNADVIVAVVGITSRLEGEERPVNAPGFKGGDRTSMDLPKEEQDLLEAMKKTGKPLVVVLMNGSPMSVNWASKHADAILEAWYSGEEGGSAIAQTLAGVNNPAGRLPVTFYTGVDQLPAIVDYSMANRTYRYFKGKPLYPFGYGLSYASFDYAALQLSDKKINAGKMLEASVKVSNTSNRAGDEVVQAYLTFPQVPGAPLRALRGFQRIQLQPGTSKLVKFQFNPRDLSYVEPDGRRVMAAGRYQLTLGGGQPDTGAAGSSAAFEIVGKIDLPK